MFFFLFDFNEFEMQRQLSDNIFDLLEIWTENSFFPHLKIFLSLILSLMKFHITFMTTVKISWRVFIEFKILTGFFFHIPTECGLKAKIDDVYFTRRYCIHFHNTTSQLSFLNVRQFKNFNFSLCSISYIPNDRFLIPMLFIGMYLSTY